MTVKCAAVYNVEVMRFTKVDSCGRPIYGPTSTLVVDCFEKLEMNADLEDGEDIAPVTAAGNQCFYVPPKKLDRGYELVATLEKWYPNLPTMLNQNWLQVMDELGNVAGYQHIPTIDINRGVAVEVWESVFGAQCDVGSTGQWKYGVSPYSSNWSPADLELGNSARSDEWGGHTLGGNAWGVGPYNVRRNASTGVAGKLQTAMNPQSHHHSELVTLAPPVASCESQPLSNPAGPTPAITACVSGGMTVGVTATSGRPMQINWGDGTAPATLVTAVQLTHVYATANRYVISVKFTDALQEESYLVANVPCP